MAVYCKLSETKMALKIETFHYIFEFQITKEIGQTVSVWLANPSYPLPFPWMANNKIFHIGEYEK